VAGNPEGSSMIDTHAHVISDDLVKYPFKENVRPESDAFFRANPSTVEELGGLMKAADVVGAVLVQTFSIYGTDNNYTMDSGTDESANWASMAFVDISEPNWRDTLDFWVSRGATGVRVVPDYCVRPLDLDDRGVLEEIQYAMSIGLGIVLTIHSGQLPQLPALLERDPEIVVALDHCGYPDLSGKHPFDAASPLFDLARYPGVHLKVSTLTLDEVVANSGDPRPFVNRLAEVFGPSRLMWGSNWRATHDRPYGQLAEFARFAFSDLSESDRASGLEDGPLKLWPATGH
jgi:predicted TIM-barrel fold metal-dependent hydrolase